MNLSTALEKYGDGTLLAVGGALIGFGFGYFSQRSKFCLRSAVIEFWHGKFNDRLAVWLLAFSTATLTAQLFIISGVLDVSGTRLIATRGSLAGALVGGLMFGAGMIMTRGCASRLLILAANGNLRALLSGLVFAVCAQASLSGILAPTRLAISGLWTVEAGPHRDILAIFGLNNIGGCLMAALWFGLAIYFGLKSQARSARMWIGGIGAGLTVPLAWLYNFQVSKQSFEVVPVQAITFSGPSAEWLMRVLTSPSPPIGFDFGLIPGVFAGSFIAAALGKELRIEGFKDGYSMTRYILGAILMGFGAMLAGGCAVGAGLSGGCIFALTSWLALIGMWAGGGLTDRLLDNPSRSHPMTTSTAIPVTVAP